MPAASLLALIDDISLILDDVAAMTKVAAKKTSGVLGDDLALNANQVSGVSADRELPVVWAVAKGSAINKVILVPAALLLSWLLPAAIPFLLVLGGLFLCFEGFEKVYEKLHALIKKEQKTKSAVAISEAEKIKGAVRTDFILSAEIIVITLGTVALETLTKQVGVLVAISILMTIGVYGLVAGIVKLDDLGLYLVNSKTGGIKPAVGRGILVFAPWLMKALGVVGTLAMFMVGGSLLVHGVPWLHHFIVGSNVWLATLFDIVVGLASGAIVLLLLHLFKYFRAKFRK